MIPYLIAGGIGGGMLLIALVVVLTSRRGQEGVGGWAPRSAARVAGDTPEPGGIEVPTSYSDGEVGRLAAQLGSRDVRARAEAARALGSLGPRAGEAVPALLDAMARPGSGVELTMAARKALRAIGPSAIPSLLGLLRSGGAKARSQAAMALGDLGPQGASAVGPLTQALEGDRDTSVRAAAAAALGAIGPPAAPALPALRRAAGNVNEKLTGDPLRAELRVRARMAIDQIRDKAGP
jgi:HEAT repeat protein